MGQDQSKQQQTSSGQHNNAVSSSNNHQQHQYQNDDLRNNSSTGEQINNANNITSQQQQPNINNNNFTPKEDAASSNNNNNNNNSNNNNQQQNRNSGASVPSNRSSGATINNSEESSGNTINNNRESLTNLPRANSGAAAGMNLHNNNSSSHGSPAGSDKEKTSDTNKDKNPFFISDGYAQAQLQKYDNNSGNANSGSVTHAITMNGSIQFGGKTLSHGNLGQLRQNNIQTQSGGLENTNNNRNSNSSTALPIPPNANNNNNNNNNNNAGGNSSGNLHTNGSFSFGHQLLRQQSLLNGHFTNEEIIVSTTSAATDAPLLGASPFGAAVGSSPSQQLAKNMKAQQQHSSFSTGNSNSNAHGVCTSSPINQQQHTFVLHNTQTAQQLREACSSLRVLLRNATRELSEDERRALKDLYDSLPHDILTNNESKQQRERVAAMWKEAFSNTRFQDTFSDEFEKLSNNMQGALFASTDLRQQARALSGMITQAMSVLNNPPSLQSLLRVLGAKHGMYGVDQKHFSFMGSALTRTLQTVLGDKFTTELQQEWSRIYSMLAQAMVHAQKEHTSNTAMAQQFRRKALQLYLTNFSRHVSRLLATIRKRAPRSDILVLCEAWMNKSSPQQILNIKPLEYKNPYNVAMTENFENSDTHSRRSQNSHNSSRVSRSNNDSASQHYLQDLEDEIQTPKDIGKTQKDINNNKTTTSSSASPTTNNNKQADNNDTNKNNNNKNETPLLQQNRNGFNKKIIVPPAAEQYPSVMHDPHSPLTVQNLTGITAAAATAAAEPLARFLTDVIENSLRAVDVDLLDQGAANCTPALLMWMRTAFGGISDKDIIKCLSQGFTTVMLHGTAANDPNVAWVDSHLQKGLTTGFHTLQSTIPFMPLVGPFAVMQIRIEEFRRLLKLNGKKMRFVVKEIDRLLTACLAACQCHRIQTEREDVEDVSNSVIIAAHVWQLVALSVMLNTTLQNLPEMPPLTITGLQLRGHGPSFRRDLPRLCVAIHQSSAASPVPRYSPSDPYRIVGVSMSELNTLSLGTAGGQTLMSMEAYRSLRHEKSLHRDGKLNSPPLVGSGLKVTLPQLDWSTFTIDSVTPMMRVGPGAKEERPPSLFSITLKVHSDREFPRPMLHGSSVRLASRSDDGNEIED